jgi:nitroreductase
MTITLESTADDRPAFARAAETSAPIHPVLADRWSPRSFDSSIPIDETALSAALEAARWAPSAGNSQPARFIVGRRGTPAFEAIAAALQGKNPAWAGSAAVLIVGVAELTDSEGTPRRWAEYDLGQALAHLSVQAHHDGLHVHQMGGFDAAAIARAFSLDDRLLPVTITALGTLAAPDALPDDVLRAREVAPRARLPLSELLLVNE